MEDRNKIRLSSERSAKSTNSDKFMSVNLEGKRRLLPSGEINEIIDVGERFNKERQESTKYRLIGTISTLFSNPLFNLSPDNDGPHNWSSFDLPLFRDRSFPSDGDIIDIEDIESYKDSVRIHLTEQNGWFGYFDPNISKAAFCDFIDMEPKRERFCFVPDKNGYAGVTIPTEPVKNWELTVTYPASIDDTHYLVNNGLVIVGAVEVIVGGRPMTAFEVPINHGLSINDTVRIAGIGGTLDGDYTVQRTGLDDGDLKINYFCVDIPFSDIVLPLNIGANAPRMKRIWAGEPSTYYFRKFKKIKTVNSDPIESDDYEIYKLAYGRNIFGDKITQFVFNDDIDVSDLVDNLGRPLSELYVTMVKTDSNGLFTNVKSGLDMNLIPSVFEVDNVDLPHIRRIHNDTAGNDYFVSHTPLESNVNISQNEFYGDVVEYNRFEVQEVVLAEVSHRYNTINREGSGSNVALGPRQEGYMYKPHYLVKIRDFSNYIEQGDVSTVGIPDYAVDLGDGRWLWRDLLDIGFNDGKVDGFVDYPFLNGSHYIHQTYCVIMKRQDPFGRYELYHKEDPIGDAITDKFALRTRDDEC
jgi:hypothetical protein